MRWFAPPLPEVATIAGEASPLEMGPIEPAMYLGQGFVWRLSDVEIAVDDVNFWREDPAALVRRALQHALFDSGRFVEGRGGPRLEVALETFEAVITGPPRARVAGDLVLRNPEGSGLMRTRIDVSEPLRGDAAEDVARGIGSALGRFATETASWLAARLTREPGPR